MSSKPCYGFFRCPKCKQLWESSHVYCSRVLGKLTPQFHQDCKNCGTSCLPYRVEPLVCKRCGEQQCICDWAEKEKRHNDPKKPHRADLCERCKKGLRCGR